MPKLRYAPLIGYAADGFSIHAMKALAEIELSGATGVRRWGRVVNCTNY